jgi:hypothetical protein
LTHTFYHASQEVHAGSPFPKRVVTRTEVAAGISSLADRPPNSAVAEKVQIDSTARYS